MRLVAFLFVLPFALPAQADEKDLDALIKRMARVYESCTSEFKAIKDGTSARARQNRLQSLGEERDQVMRTIAGLNLKAQDREAAQAMLTRTIQPLIAPLQAEVARVSLIPEALAVVEDLPIVKEMATLLEDRARFQIRSVDQALQIAALRDNGVYPKKLEDAARYVGDTNNLRDPWGREWQYDVAGKRNDGKKPDVWTVSPFGGGKKEIGNWAEKR
jgi:hypothetical protein